MGIHSLFNSETPQKMTFSSPPRSSSRLLSKRSRFNSDVIDLTDSPVLKLLKSDIVIDLTDSPVMESQTEVESLIMDPFMELFVDPFEEPDMEPVMEPIVDDEMVRIMASIIGKEMVEFRNSIRSSESTTTSITNTTDDSWDDDVIYDIDIDDETFSLIYSGINQLTDAHADFENDVSLLMSYYD